MIGDILIDTGPLIALLDSDSQQHEWMANIWNHVRAPALTCEPVLTEITFLRGSRCFVRTASIWRAESRNTSTAGGGGHSRFDEEVRNIPMSLADACLVRLSELNPKHRLVSFDSDFKVYRKHGNRVIPLLSPENRA